MTIHMCDFHPLGPPIHFMTGPCLAPVHSSAFNDDSKNRHKHKLMHAGTKAGRTDNNIKDAEALPSIWPEELDLRQRPPMDEKKA